MMTFVEILKNGRVRWWAVIVLIVVAFAAGALWRGSGPREAQRHETMNDAPTSTIKAEIWTCSMHPQIKLAKAGKCPICGMDLIPLDFGKGDMGAGLRELSVSKHAAALMKIQTVPVQKKFVTAEVRMVGKVAYDETRVSYITAWVPGRLDRLYVNYTGVPVKKGDHMVYLYSPELLGAQEELIQTVKTAKQFQKNEGSATQLSTNATVEAVREKLRLWGLTQDQIAEIEIHGKPSDHMTIYAPVGGIVIHKNANEGMYVQTGARIYTIADLSSVWVLLNAYESDLMWLRYGQAVEFTAESYPGKVFKGVISFIDPVLNQATRTVKVRVNVANPELKLKPGMFLRAVARANVASGGKVMNPDLAGKWICPMHPEVVKDSEGTCEVCGMPLVKMESLGYVGKKPTPADAPLVIPATAPLITGTRAIVYVSVPGKDRPTYEGREILLGPRAGDYYLVQRGLQEGDQIVTRGSFKLDAELQIRAKPSMMTPEGGGHAHHGAGPAGKLQPTGYPEVTMPTMVRDALHAVVSAAKDAIAMVSDGDLQKTRDAFANLGVKVDAVPRAQLSARPAMLWKEHSMLLGNDGQEGHGAATPADAQRIAAQTHEHLMSLEADFGLIHELELSPALVADETFRLQLARVVTDYLAIQTALAEDESPKAVAGARQALKSLADVEMQRLSGTAHVDWMQDAGQLQAILTRLVGAEGIEAVRKEFALLSEQMAATLMRFRPLPAKTYQFKCPMAFNNRGASWLQVDDGTRNPYFGKTMPKCGDIVQVISAGELKEGREHE